MTQHDDRNVTREYKKLKNRKSNLYFSFFCFRIVKVKWKIKNEFAFFVFYFFSQSKNRNWRNFFNFGFPFYGKNERVPLRIIPGLKTISGTKILSWPRKTTIDPIGRNTHDKTSPTKKRKTETLPTKQKNEKLKIESQISFFQFSI